MTGMGLEKASAALQQFGPALVARFKVHEDFLHHKVHHHHGQPRGSVKGLHAMALVGSRIGDDGKLYLLLQHWWPDKQFVEVDAEYFEACGAYSSPLHQDAADRADNQVPDAHPAHPADGSDHDNREFSTLESALLCRIFPPN